jgi:hypothetical protein
MSSKNALRVDEVPVLVQHYCETLSKDAPKPGRRSHIKNKISNFFHSSTKVTSNPPQNEKTTKAIFPAEILDMIWNHIIEWLLDEPVDIPYSFHPIARIWQYRGEVGTIPSLNTCFRSRQLLLKHFPLVLSSYKATSGRLARRNLLGLKNQDSLPPIYMRHEDTLYLQGSPYGRDIGKWMDNLRGRWQLGHITVLKIDIGASAFQLMSPGRYSAACAREEGHAFAQHVRADFLNWKELHFKLARGRTFTDMIEFPMPPHPTRWDWRAPEAHFFMGICDILRDVPREGRRRKLYIAVMTDQTLRMTYKLL